jgi:hypothetical protein
LSISLGAEQEKNCLMSFRQKYFHAIKQCSLTTADEFATLLS